ncbi:MAG: hypothetical protein MPK36_09140, partial [Gammaproteobacteria bacterium]|nr:hypothetical protein [Gammaproteobacteria bacterium]
MKHVNLDPQLEKKKEEIMREFRENEASAKPAEPAAAPEKSPSSASSPSGEELQARVIEALKTIYDPEIPVNIYDLG